MAEMNLLETGIYSVSEAAELVGASERQVRGWLVGYADRAPPLLTNELGWLQGRLALSFTNLMELRFVAFFANAGLRLPYIRSIMDEVRTTVAHPHPFATNIVFKTDGKKIVAEIGKKRGIPDIYDLKSRNYELQPIVLASLQDDVLFDPNGDAAAWRPRPKIAPNVIVHPKIAFGRPVLRRSHIPTRSIADAVRAEGSQSVVAELYEIPAKQVAEAVKFEDHLREAA